MNSAFNEADMRARYHELTARREQIVGESAPHRAEYDRLAKAIHPLEAEQREHAKKFKAIEADLPEIDTERAMLSRALKGKTGAS